VQTASTITVAFPHPRYDVITDCFGVLTWFEKLFFTSLSLSLRMRRQIYVNAFDISVAPITCILSKRTSSFYRFMY
jgi:hypothetical protein